MKGVVLNPEIKKNVRFMVYADNKEPFILTKDNCVLCSDSNFSVDYTEEEYNFEYAVRSIVLGLRKLFKNVQCNKVVTYVDFSFD